MSDTKQPIGAQPQGTAPMQVLGGNRNTKNCPIGPDGKRDWSFGLFDCFDRCGLCCWSTWCPCVVFSKNKQRLKSLRTQGTPLVGGGETYDSNCCIYGGLDITGYSWVMQLRTREEIRDRYGIHGAVSGDCFSSWCCRPCALTQERREIELEESSF
ncbi:PLAC8-domain-containing protein [Russula aff. rugulosa BPL654]|nr:PLAC8-domain-containing protein [Russula aff. rugulosa BPL654]